MLCVIDVRRRIYVVGGIAPTAGRGWMEMDRGGWRWMGYSAVEYPMTISGFFSDEYGLELGNLCFDGSSSLRSFLLEE